MVVLLILLCLALLYIYFIQSYTKPDLYHVRCCRSIHLMSPVVVVLVAALTFLFIIDTVDITS